MPTLRLLRQLVGVLVMIVALGACESQNNPFGGDPGDSLPDAADFVVSEPIRPPEFDFLWERTKFMLQTERYGVDSLRTNREDMRIVSRWKTLLAPSRYKGVRRRVVIDFVEADPGAYLLYVAVQVQRNEDVDSPMDVSYAVWKDQPASKERANVWLFRIEDGF